MKCYKVVNKNGNGQMVSCVIGNSGVGREYVVGKWTKALPSCLKQGYGLMAFGCLDAAFRFVAFQSHWGDLQVFEAEGEGQMELPRRWLNTRTMRFSRRAAVRAMAEESEIMLKSWPEGSLCFSKIKILKERLNTRYRRE